jgi:uroporphyrin-III C-methyltransferase
MTTGFVSLVGAGPGDPELLTLKAHRAIAQATAIVYDRLVGTDIVAMANPEIPHFFAGKSCSQKAMTQEEINALLVKLAKEGHRVVRLKGGDPFLFGRGGEEALELVANDIPFETIPGISSAQGISASVGIPLTHRGIATSVQFITGHRMADGKLDLHWEQLTSPDTTLVIYMGLKNCTTICEELIRHGMDANTPTAIIQQGTTADERCHHTVLSKLPAEVIEQEFKAPSLIIIGKATELGKRLTLDIKSTK